MVFAQISFTEINIASYVAIRVKELLCSFLNGSISTINKPGTAKVGAISKAQSCKKVTFWDFLTSVALQNIKTNESETLWCNPKISKSHSAEKNPSEKHQSGTLSMFSRFWTSMFFVLDEVLAFRVCFGRPYFILMLLSKWKKWTVRV